VSTKAQASSRLPFVDVLRGVGVVLMVQLHTSHGWLRPELREGPLWRLTQFLGGLAAPIFLTLAGVSLGLRWARRGAPDFGADLRRALSILVLGYLLRLQMWFIDAAGYARAEALFAQVLLLCAYALAYFTLVRPPDSARRELAAWCGIGILLVAGLIQVSEHAPDRMAGLLRVDVLQCIGGSLAVVVAVGAVQGSSSAGRGFARVRGYLLLAAAVALITIWTRSWVPGRLPAPIAAYLGQWPAAPGHSVIALFPLFPWTAYTAFGCAIGLYWSRIPAAQRVARGWQLAGVALAAALLTTESLPLAHGLLSSLPAWTQPVRVLNRMGWVMVLWAMTGAWRATPAAELSTPLETLGRASLLVYWVHLQFAFGAASSPIAKSLGYRAWAIGSAMLVLAMWLLAYIRVGRARSPAPGAPRPKASGTGDAARSAPG
jgi:uncharacterized membrane protein